MTRGLPHPYRHALIIVLAVLTVLVFVSIFTRTNAADVFSIQINAGIERFDDTLVVDPYYLDITVEVSGIAGIDVTSPAGCTGSRDAEIDASPLACD